MKPIRLTINCIPRTKKNSQRIVKFGKRWAVIPSRQYVEFENIVGQQISDDVKSCCVASPVNVSAVFYMPTRRKVDLTNLLEAIDDALVKCGVLEDDNCAVIVSHDGSRVKYDKEHPRIEVEITDSQDADENFIKRKE